ncbi:xyloglucan galactosyltransferase KATAMARI1-like [Quillaja saponaria]|uniref:Xyloglucan galactosyltransferase KATAMARI1-like n=1 Tax=Quillaja saponaria TaxID=32244 RepID=A0AAD7QCP8_QUISA|nr:xyloglucan galactosyltransferase KATAMARI1-like [Quillaja saponaria]
MHALKPKHPLKFADNPNNLTPQVTGNFTVSDRILVNDTKNKQDPVIGIGVNNISEQVSPAPMAIYVPYYPGLDVGQDLWGFNTSVRDASPKALVKWLAQRPEWKRMWGRDHFLVGGRIGLDYRRRTGNDSDWGTKLTNLPEARNMSLLPIESGTYNNEFPIPYPTYFHPSSDDEVLQWQRRMRRKKRPYLFSFSGAPRPESPDAIRNELIEQCQSSVTCKFLGCYHGA